MGYMIIWERIAPEEQRCSLGWNPLLRQIPTWVVVENESVSFSAQNEEAQEGLLSYKGFIVAQSI